MSGLPIHVHGLLGVGPYRQPAGRDPVPHLHDRFQAHFGLSPHQWLMRRRLHAARQLLAATDQPIVEIADACGFADAAAFCRAFKRGEGTSPAAWRRQGRLGPR